jgi:hypothetical protein
MQILPSENRACPRASLSVYCLVREIGGRWVQTILYDLSCTGFRTSRNPGYRIGSVLTFKFPDLESMICDVRWKNHRDVGCSFRRPLSPYVFDHIAASYFTEPEDLDTSPRPEIFSQ